MFSDITALKHQRKRFISLESFPKVFRSRMHFPKNGLGSHVYTPPSTGSTVSSCATQERRVCIMMAVTTVTVMAKYQPFAVETGSYGVNPRPATTGVLISLLQQKRTLPAAQTHMLTVCLTSQTHVGLLHSDQDLRAHFMTSN